MNSISQEQREKVFKINTSYSPRHHPKKDFDSLSQVSKAYKES